MVLQKSYDYVVVGAGSAGCVVAARLAEEKLGTVLLLEIGQSAAKNPEILAADGFKYTFANDNTMLNRMSVNQKNSGMRSIYCGSGTGVGGSGSVNGMVYTRGDRLDFTQWPKSWQWEDVEPFYQALEKRLGITFREPTEFTEAAIQAAIRVGFQRKNSLNDGDLCGYIGYNDMNFNGDQRRSSYISFIHGREKELELLTLKTEVQVTKILFDENKTAVAIEFLEDVTKHNVGVKKEVVMCAGALETPKLLMLSGVGPKTDLEKFAIPKVAEIESIGKNLQDHPSVCIFYKTNKPIDFYYPQVYGFQRLNQKLALPSDQADVCFTFFSTPTVIEGTLKKLVPLMILPARLHAIQKLRYAIRGLVALAFRLPMLNRFVEKVYGFVAILGKPVSRGEIHLQSGDPKDQALIDLAYYSDPADTETMLAAVELVNRMVQQPELQDWGSRPLSKASASSNPEKVRKWVQKASMTAFHFCGTCAMGESPVAPVAPDLKLKGIKNVRIADASVIPQIPVSAMNAPSMLIGYRAAEFIKQEAS